MNQEKISDLLMKYRSGEATEEELQVIESLIGKGVLQLEDLDDVNRMLHAIERIETPSPSLKLDDAFYQMLATEKKQQRGFSFRDWFPANIFLPQIAYASMMLVAGLAIGYFVFNKSGSSSEEVIALSNEVKSLKETMMLSLLEKESATDRLKAVSLSQELDESSEAVTKALIKTLNNDENVNVRLAALEALAPYGKSSEVREALIKSISKQQSPLVQIALAELMAMWQEKKAVTEFDKLLEDDKTPKEVKTRIRKSIEVLI